MIIVLLVIFIILGILGRRYDYDTAGIFGSIMSFCLATVALVAMIVLICEASCASVLKDKIEMYEEENAAIETQIADIVKGYQKYEQEAFTEFSYDDAVTMVSLYPELKSDTLVQKQIEVYVENNSKIKELREQEITAEVVRWWLYFGR